MVSPNRDHLLTGFFKKSDVLVMPIHVTSVMRIQVFDFPNSCRPASYGQCLIMSPEPIGVRKSCCFNMAHIFRAILFAGAFANNTLFLKIIRGTQDPS